MKRLNVVTIQMVKEKTLTYETNKILSPQDAVGIFRKFLDGVDREHMVVACLDTKNKITAIHTIAIGSLSAAVIHPREVFKTAILANSASLILCHNHPSGDPTPSHEDIEVTRRIVDGGELLGIQVLDHIILGDDRHYSMKEHGHI